MPAGRNLAGIALHATATQVLVLRIVNTCYHRVVSRREEQ